MLDASDHTPDQTPDRAKVDGAVDMLTGQLRRHRRAAVVAGLLAADTAAVVIAQRYADNMAAWLAAPVRHVPAGALVAALVVCFLGMGLYSGAGPSPFERFRLRFIGFLLITGALLIALLTSDDYLPAIIAVANFAAMLQLLGFYFDGGVRRFLIAHGLWGARTVLVGPADAILPLTRTLLYEAPDCGLRPIATLDPDGGALPDLPIPAIHALRDIAGETAEMVVFTSQAAFAALETREPDALARFRTLVLDANIDRRNLWQPTRDLGVAPGREIRGAVALTRERRVKRAFDLVVGIPLAILTAPFIAIAGLVVWLIDRGPVIYVQNRIGLGGKTVRIFKLRTMYQDAEKRLERLLAEDPSAREEWGRYFKLRNDPRILPVVGRFLRSSSIDELPQFWNVVRGDISLVGPRPFPTYHLDSFDDAFRAERATVPPGITGLWQVSARSDGDIGVQARHDTDYIRNWSIWLDIYVMFQTLGAVVAGRGAR